MRIPIQMSQIGAGQDSATITAWLKEVGDPVARGDALVEVEVEKVDMEIEAFDEGTLVEVVAPVGETVAVGQVIAYLESGDSAA